MKVTTVYSGEHNTIEPNVIIGYSFRCPGCDRYHSFTTNPKFWDGGVWNFNGNTDSPSFEPSLLVNKDHLTPGVPRCHSWVTDGKIRFFDDCDHDLKGQTVEMFDIQIND